MPAARAAAAGRSEFTLLSRGNTTVEYKTYMCVICGFIYEEEKGLPEENIPAGTRWEDIPETWTCPDCGASKDDFEMVEV